LRRPPKERGSKMRRKFVAILAGVCLLFSAMPIWAHHSFAAEFDVNKPLTLKGTLKKWEVINPHSWFHIEVKDEAGEIVLWMVEGGSPNTLIRNGITKNSVPIGTDLVIEGYAAKDGTRKVVGRNFLLSDGRRLFLGGAAPGQPSGP
jgi:hypothetical protein